jgi:predicted RNA-binding Zn-ribbon protein involved in translation (DUF1610 family)
MPDFSEHEARVPCPLCGAQVDADGALLRFHWGGVPSSYKIGDGVRWFRDKLGSLIPAFHGVERRSFLFFTRMVFNFGAPNCGDLYIIENDPLVDVYRCKSCGRELEGLAVEIQGGVFRSGAALAPGQTQKRFGIEKGFANIISMRDGKPKPRPDWNDPPFTSED